MLYIQAIYLGPLSFYCIFSFSQPHIPLKLLKLRLNRVPRVLWPGRRGSTATSTSTTTGTTCTPISTTTTTAAAAATRTFVITTSTTASTTTATTSRFIAPSPEVLGPCLQPSEAPLAATNVTLPINKEKINITIYYIL